MGKFITVICLYRLQGSIYSFKKKSLNGVFAIQNNEEKKWYSNNFFFPAMNNNHQFDKNLNYLCWSVEIYPPSQQSKLNSSQQISKQNKLLIAI